ncbi:Ump1p [Sporobolomyces salmoneus]|uniref:Ump1p n=1 Tax=Sporobolomyces salmoneus TaxID=183962 RepID=UPI003171848F
MESSLALVPGPSTSSSSSHQPSSISLSSTSNAHGLHDTLRHGGLRSIAAEVAPQHPLQSRLNNWEQTREDLHMTLERNMFGLHAPVRQMMERQIVSSSPKPLHLGGFTRESNLGLEILLNKDQELSPEDVLVDRVETSQLGDFHMAMERKLRLP